MLVTLSVSTFLKQTQVNICKIATEETLNLYHVNEGRWYYNITGTSLIFLQFSTSLLLFARLWWKTVLKILPLGSD